MRFSPSSRQEEQKSINFDQTVKKFIKNEKNQKSKQLKKLKKN